MKGCVRGRTPRAASSRGTPRTRNAHGAATAPRAPSSTRRFLRPYRRWPAGAVPPPKRTPGRQSRCGAPGRPGRETPDDRDRAPPTQSSCAGKDSAKSPLSPARAGRLTCYAAAPTFRRVPVRRRLAFLLVMSSLAAGCSLLVEFDRAKLGSLEPLDATDDVTK